MNKFKDEVIINHKYSIRNVPDSSSFKSTGQNMNMSKIQDQLIKQNKLHYDELLQTQLVSKNRTESFSFSNQSVLQQTTEDKVRTISKPQKDNQKELEKQSKHKMSHNGVCTINDVK